MSHSLLLFAFLISAIASDDCYKDRSGALSFESLRSLVEKNPSIDNPGELLSFFKNHPDLQSYLSKENYLLFPKSGALHSSPKEVNAEYPSIVLHKDKLLLRIDGRNPLVEVVELDPRKRTFNLLVIDFSAKGAKRFRQDLAVDVHKDPEKLKLLGVPFGCAACHGSNAPEDKGLLLRPKALPPPLFAKGRTVPFGSVDDSIRKNSPEFKDWSQYQTTLKDKTRGARYRYLEPWDVEETADALVLKNRPNERFWRHVSQLNHVRVGQALKGLPLYGALQYAIVAGFLNCENFKDILPLTYRTQAEKIIRRLKRTNQAHEYPADVVDKAKLSPEQGQELAREGKLNLDFNQLSAVAKGDLLQVYEHNTAMIVADEQLLTLTPFLPFPRPTVEAALAAKEKEIGKGAVDKMKKAIAQDGRNVPRLAKLRYLLEGQGTPASFLGTSIGGGDWDVRLGLEELFKCELAPDFLKAHPELDVFGGAPTPEFFDGKPNEKKSFCAKLQQKSQAAFALLPSNSTTSVPAFPAVHEPPR